MLEYSTQWHHGGVPSFLSFQRSLPASRPPPRELPPMHAAWETECSGKPPPGMLRQEAVPEA